MSETYVTVQGWVGSDPEFKQLNGRIPRATFRVGSTPRHLQPGHGWTDRPTNWFHVECWRTLAQNTYESIHLGQPVIVTGRFRTHEWTTESGESRSRTVLDAIAVGHDLSKGTTTFTKSPPRPETQWPTPQSLNPAQTRVDSLPSAPAADPGEPAPSADSSVHSGAPDPGLVSPFPSDEFPPKPLPLTPSTPESTAA